MGEQQPFSLARALGASVAAKKRVTGDLAPGEIGIEADDGLVMYFRVRPISSADLAEQQMAHLMTVRGLRDVVAPARKHIDGEDGELDAAELNRIIAQVKAVGQSAVREAGAILEARICAAVTAIGYRFALDGDGAVALVDGAPVVDDRAPVTWEDVRIVRDIGQHDPDASPPRLHITALPSSVRAPLSDHILKVSEGEGALGVLRSFRRDGNGPAPAQDAGPDREAARPDDEAGD